MLQTTGHGAQLRILVAAPGATHAYPLRLTNGWRTTEKRCPSPMCHGQRRRRRT